ncbi:MAG: DUF1934 domain-containing protein [Eubacteriales bacterium]|jgi:uncharacterized beta-barrel protein YwiB (DUF1934 family)
MKRKKSVPVKIKIKAKQLEYASLPEELSELLATEYIEEDTSNQSFELITDGMLSERGGRINIQYEESELTGLGGSVTNISFDESNTALVTMSRTGHHNTFLTFEKGKRHLCAYESPVQPYQLCVSTREVKNKLTGRGGLLELDYVLEINGTSAEHSELSMRVEISE